MVKDISELKELIMWAKSMKVKSLKLGDTQFELSDLALVEGLQDISQEAVQAQKDLSTPASSPRLPNGNTEVTDEEELLFWSAR